MSVFFSFKLKSLEFFEEKSNFFVSAWESFQLIEPPIQDHYFLIIRKYCRRTI